VSVRTEGDDQAKGWSIDCGYPARERLTKRMRSLIKFVMMLKTTKNCAWLPQRLSAWIPYRNPWLWAYLELTVSVPTVWVKLKGKCGKIHGEFMVFCHEVMHWRLLSKQIFDIVYGLVTIIRFKSFLVFWQACVKSQVASTNQWMRGLFLTAVTICNGCPIRGWSSI
jgi:hypothetical protein